MVTLKRSDFLKHLAIKNSKNCVNFTASFTKCYSSKTLSLLRETPMSYCFSSIYTEHSYCMFLPDNEVRERRNVVQFLTFLKFLKIFLSMKSFNAIQAIFYSYLVTKRQNTIATNITYITVN